MEDELQNIMPTEIAEHDTAAEEQPQQQELHEKAVCDAEPTHEQQQCQDLPTATRAVQQHDAAAQHDEVHATSHAHHFVHHHHSSDSGHGSMGSLTFSGPPYIPKAKPCARADYSHSTNRLMKITHDNKLLVDRLMSISRKEPEWVREQQNKAPCNTASSAVNRHKQATTVAQENHALYQRLVAIRPSKDISRETLEAEHRRNELYRINCATFKPHGTL